MAIHAKVYNVVRGLRRCFGLKTGVITAFADNEVGMLMEDFILQGGVDTSLIKWMKTDGIGRICRNGINFTERGYGIRGAVGCSDRANTAISKVSPKDFDFDYIFGELGARWLHTDGIYAALSEQSCETVLAAIKTATVNDWSAICWADGEIYKAKDYKGLEIMDRVGGGDSFASGHIYGLMTTGNAELAVNYGAAHGALAMTTPGDTTMANKKEVEAIMGSAGARVQR